MARWLAVIGTIAMAATAPSAYAGWRLDLAAQVADLYWGPPPCPVTIRWLPLPAAAAEADWRACTVTFTTRTRWRGFGRLCTAMLHERGHIQRGDGWHSSDPGDVMFPRLTRVVPACRLATEEVV